jgi:toxic protein SymE
MQSNKSPKKAAVRRPEVRSLKIQPKFRTNTFEIKDVPEIRLCGNWLEKLGFFHGKRVVITTMNELLIIRLQPE